MKWLDGITNSMNMSLSKLRELVGTVSIKQAMRLVVQLLRHVRLCNHMDCSTPGSSVLHYLPVFVKFMSVESVKLPKHLSLCHPHLLSPSSFPSIRVFSSELALCIRWPKYWSFSISPSNEYSGLISFRIDWFYPLAVQGILKSLLQHHSLKASILQHSAFLIV